MIFTDMNMIDEERSGNQSYDALAKIFKVLTHPARLAILEILQDGEHCVCHMEAYLGYRQAYISQQLSVLRDAGLVQDRRDGWNIFYHVTDKRVYEVLDVARRLVGRSEVEPRKPNVVCNCPKCSSKADAT